MIDLKRRISCVSFELVKWVSMAIPQVLSILASKSSSRVSHYIPEL